MPRLWANAQPVVIFGSFLRRDSVLSWIPRVSTAIISVPFGTVRKWILPRPIGWASSHAGAKRSCPLLRRSIPQTGDWGPDASKSKILVKTLELDWPGGVAPSSFSLRNVFGALLGRQTRGEEEQRPSLFFPRRRELVCGARRKPRWRLRAT